MAIISELGSEKLYFVLLSLIYWCLDKRLGKFLGYVFLLTAMLNTMTKGLLRQPRPYWLDPSVALTEEDGYGLASGHTQLAATFYFFLAGWYGKFWLWLVALAAVFTIALSRIYLGAHFVQDVLAGMLMALLLLLLAALWRRKLASRFEKRNLGRRLLVLVTVPLALLAVYVAVLLVLGSPDLGVPWAAYIPAADRAARETMATALGATLGYGIGILFEGSRVRFQTAGTFWQRAARFVLGVGVAFVLWAGLDLLFPVMPEWLGLPLRALRYFLVFLWISYFAPWVFVRLRLAAADPQPEIKVSL